MEYFNLFKEPQGYNLLEVNSRVTLDEPIYCFNLKVSAKDPDTSEILLTRYEKIITNSSTKAIATVLDFFEDDYPNYEIESIAILDKKKN